MAKGNRPRIERKEFLNKVYEKAQLGLRDHEIKRLLHVDDRIWSNWIVKGKADVERCIDSAHSRFVRLLEHARSSQTENALRDIQKESKAGVWQASKILLEQNQAYNTERNAGVNITINDLRRIDIHVLRDAIASGDYDSIVAMLTMDSGGGQ